MFEMYSTYLLTTIRITSALIKVGVAFSNPSQHSVHCGAIVVFTVCLLQAPESWRVETCSHQESLQERAPHAACRRLGRRPVGAFRGRGCVFTTQWAGPKRKPGAQSRMRKHAATPANQ